MLLDQLNSTRARIHQILLLLREHHAFEFPIKDPTCWPQLLEHYHQVQQHIQNNHEFNSYHADPMYARAVLITEAVRMLLEISPRRMRKKVKESQESQVHHMTKLNEKAKKAKPDFLDVDKDGDKEESMKKALQDKEKARKLDEKWDAHMKTAPKDVGKWEGYTIAELKARKKTLMDKESRSAAEQKEVRQINFAIRAKQENSWGKIKEHDQNQVWVVTFVDDHSDDAHTVEVKAGSITQARSRFRAEYPGSYIEKVALKKQPLKEDQSLDQAETLLAAKDMSDRLQGMAEDAAKMAVDRLMPLVDTMKSQFGQEAAEGFNSVVKTQLQTVLDTIVAAKDATDNAIMSLQGGETPVDATHMDITADLPAAAPSDEAPAPEGDMHFEKEFDAVPPASGPTEEPLGRERKTRTDEARKRNPYAIGMAQAKKEMGYSDAPAKDLPKKVIMRAHEIARSIENTNESQQLEHMDTQLRELIQNYKLLDTQLQEHQVQFASSGAPDPLGLGRGLEGDRIHSRMKQLAMQIREMKSLRDDLRVQLQEQAVLISTTQQRVQRLAEQATTRGYGVVGVNQEGVRVKQFFESATLRNMWLEYNAQQLKEHVLIDPDRITQVQQRLSRTIQK